MAIIKFRKKVSEKGGEDWKPIAGIVLPVLLVESFSGNNQRDEEKVKELYSFNKKRIIKFWKFQPTATHKSGVIALIYDKFGNRLDPRIENPGITDKGYIDLKIEAIPPQDGEELVREVLKKRERTRREDA